MQAGGATIALISSSKNLALIRSRVKYTLEKGMQIDLTRESCKKFLRRHVDQKIAVVILYVDINSSTKMSISLPAVNFASILRVFSQEMTLLIEDHGGYVLKYVGDAVIALFPAEYDKHEASGNALDCAKEMHKIISGSINPELVAHGMPEISIKTSLDYGELLVVLYGKGSKSHIDTVGSSISMASKMLAFAKTGQVIIGDSFYKNLATDGRRSKDFRELRMSPKEWSYVDGKSGVDYKLYVASP